MDTIKNESYSCLGCGHICRMSDTHLVKAFVLGMTESTQAQVTSPKRWSDHIEEWCNCTLLEALRLPEDRQVWRKIRKKAKMLV